MTLRRQNFSGNLYRSETISRPEHVAPTRAVQSDRNGPRLDVAAAYVSAMYGANVVDDVYDIFPLDAHWTLILVAYVSGEGIETAVDSTFVK